MKFEGRNRSTIFTILLIAIFFGLSCKLGNQQADEKVLLIANYETGYGGYIYPVYKPFVFLKNGTVIKSPVRALEALDHKSRDTKQASWGKWKASGNKVNITWDGERKDGSRYTTEEKWNSPVGYSAKRGETLEGTWSSVGGGGNIAFGGNFGSMVVKRFTFRSDGLFTTEKTGGVSDTNMTVYSKKDSAGKYTLNGYTLTLKFNNGETSQLFFCYLGNDRNVFNIAGSNYTKSK